MMATIKGILIDSFQSKKWYRADRMHYAPSVHRTFLSETLARNFDPDRREKWLETVSSSLSPSRKPVDPAEATKAPTPQELRERYISNRASYLRIKSCPPEYMIPRRYYTNIIKRNRTFARECKTITGMMPLDTRDGESFRSFLLGARYTDLHYVSGGMIKKRDARSCSHPLKSKKVQDNAAPKIDTGLRRQSTSKAAPPHDLPTQDSTEAKKKASRSSPLPIAVVGSKPSSPFQPDHDGSHSGSLPNTETVGPTQTSASVVEPESNSNSNMEIINMEEAAMAESLAKPMEMIEENEQDFISLEAQKLTGAILKESELEEQEEDDSKETQDLHHTLPASLPTVPPQQDHEGTTDGIKQESQGEGLASVHGSDFTPTVVEAVEVGVADMHPDHEEHVDKDMTSKSSTIFVDMTGLNIQSHEDLEPQS